MVLTTYTLLCNTIQSLFHLTKLDLYIHQTGAAYFPLCPAPANYPVLSVSEFALSSTSCQQNHTNCFGDLSHLMSPLQVSPMCSLCPVSFLFKAGNMPSGTFSTFGWFIHWMADTGLYLLLVAVNDAAVSIGVKVSFWDCSQPFKYIPERGIVGHTIILILVFEKVPYSFSYGVNYFTALIFSSVRDGGRESSGEMWCKKN